MVKSDRSNKIRWNVKFKEFLDQNKKKCRSQALVVADFVEWAGERELT